MAQETASSKPEIRVVTDDDIPSERTIEARGSSIGTGNRMRRRNADSLARPRFKSYFAVRVKPYIQDGHPAAMLTFVGLSHQLEIEVSGATLAALHDALAWGHDKDGAV